MSSNELRRELNRLYEEWSDLERERDFILRKTPVHLTDFTRKRLDQDLDNLKQKIEIIETIFRQRGFGVNLLRKKST